MGIEEPTHSEVEPVPNLPMTEGAIMTMTTIRRCVIGVAQKGIFRRIVEPPTIWQDDI